MNGPLMRPTKVLWQQLQEFEGGFLQPLSVIERSSEEFLGNCGFMRVKNRQYDLECYMAFRVKYWRKGLASELLGKLLDIAFNSLRARRVIGIIHPENAQSLRLVEKHGFHFSGNYVASGSEWQIGHPIYEVFPRSV